MGIAGAGWNALGAALGGFGETAGNAYRLSEERRRQLEEEAIRRAMDTRAQNEEGRRAESYAYDVSLRPEATADRERIRNREIVAAALPGRAIAKQQPYQAPLPSDLVHAIQATAPNLARFDPSRGIHVWDPTLTGDEVNAQVKQALEAQELEARSGLWDAQGKAAQANANAALIGARSLEGNRNFTQRATIARDLAKDAIAYMQNAYRPQPGGSQLSAILTGAAPDTDTNRVAEILPKLIAHLRAQAQLYKLGNYMTPEEQDAMWKRWETVAGVNASLMGDLPEYAALQGQATQQSLGGEPPPVFDPNAALDQANAVVGGMRIRRQP